MVTIVCVIFVLVLSCGSVLADCNQQQSCSGIKDFTLPERSSKIFYKNKSIEESIKFAKKMSVITNVEEFRKMMNIVPTEKTYTPDSFSERFSDIRERSNAIEARPANCMLELQTIPINYTEHHVTTFPLCIRVQRCGGCCYHDLLSCQPNENGIVIKNYKVTVFFSNKTVKDEIIPVEEHVSCQCDYIEKREDCSGKQIYNKGEYKCECPNTEEERDCNSKSNIKEWISKECTCKCKDHSFCDAGSYFDENLCRCNRIPISESWFNSYNWQNTSFSETPIEFLFNQTNSRRRHREDPE